MTRRRGNHEGTITKRKDGLWQAAITVGGGRGGAKKKYAYAKTRGKAARSSRPSSIRHQQESSLQMAG